MPRIGFAAENILMTGTHSHSSPPPGAVSGSATGTLDPNTVAHGKRAAGLIMDAVRKAKANPPVIFRRTTPTGT
jgi:hypothetical protein